MELKVHLIWTDFPQNKFRVVLREALMKLDLLPCWNEYRAKQKGLPTNYLAIRKNSLVVNGRVVYIMDDHVDVSADELVQRIIAFERFPEVKGRLSFKNPIIPAVMVALLPKCPFCLAAYFGVFGVTGLELLPYYPWIKYVSICVLTVVIAMLIYKARKANSFAAVYFMAVGTIFLILGKMLIQSDVFMVAGLVLILVASMLNTSFRLTLKRPAFRFFR